VTFCSLKNDVDHSCRSARQHGDAVISIRVIASSRLLGLLHWGNHHGNITQHNTVAMLCIHSHIATYTVASFFEASLHRSVFFCVAEAQQATVAFALAV